ncbi:MAG: hypothetical protein Q8Q24_02375, partial [bacterium]|nr:hypothetical protein [bacterium]
TKKGGFPPPILNYANFLPLSACFFVLSEMPMKVPARTAKRNPKTPPTSPNKIANSSFTPKKEGIA